MPRLRPGLRRPDPRPRADRPARTTRWSWSRSEFGRTPKINTDRRPRPLAEGVQRRAGRRRHQEAASIYGTSNATASRAGRRPDRPRGPGHHRLPPAGHRRRQGTDGPRRPPDRNRRRRQGASRSCWLKLSTQRACASFGGCAAACTADELPGRCRVAVPRMRFDPTCDCSRTVGIREHLPRVAASRHDARTYLSTSPMRGCS